MKVGIINLYTKPRGIQYLKDALELLGVSYELHSISNPHLTQLIQKSRISHWIFSGSDRSVKKKDAPQVPPEIFKMNKKFLLICYSMESALLGLGYPIHTRKEKVKEWFKLDEKIFWRNHFSYTPSYTLDSKVKEIASYKGEAMTVEYKNSLMTQWHPERTPDGLEVLLRWIQNKKVF